MNRLEKASWLKATSCLFYRVSGEVLPTSICGIEPVCARWMCSGPHTRLQNMMRFQSNSESSVDMITEIVKFLLHLEHEILDAVSKGNKEPLLVAERVFRTLRVLVRGPNWAAFNAVLSTKLFEVINRHAHTYTCSK